MADRETFLAGEAVEDVAFFLHDEVVSDADALLEHGEAVADGVVLVVSGEEGRDAFRSATGIDPMGLAQAAMGNPGEIDRDLTGGTCPAAADRPDDEHAVRLVFAFAEERNEEVGGIYAEGDVIHAYAVCACGERYSEKWVADGTSGQ